LPPSIAGWVVLFVATSGLAAQPAAITPAATNTIINILLSQQLVFIVMDEPFLKD